jgi:hypothetical protein
MLLSGWLLKIRKLQMKTIFKSTLAAAALAGAAVMVPTVASAGVSVSVGVPGVAIGVGVPGVVYAPGPGYDPYDGGMYYDPIYFGGAWYHGPYRWRMEHGERVFFVDGGWHRNEWGGRPIPGSLTFSNGGYYRGGRYDGFNDADRINARFPADRGMVRGDRPDLKSDRGDMRQDRGDMRQDRQDKPDAATKDDARRDRPDGPHN